MSKPLAFLVIASFLAFLWPGLARAQSPEPPSLKNTVWKFYVQQLNDTLTMHFGTDTTWTTSGTGEMIVRSLWKESKDTLWIDDIDGTYPCPGQQGVYRRVNDGDTMSWILVSDLCEGRAGTLNGIKFIRPKS